MKRTLDIFECDVCGKEGRRYQVVYEEGTWIMDRCERHAKKIEALKDEPGQWQSNRPAKTTFKKSTVAELRAAVAQGKPKSEANGDPRLISERA